MSYSMKNLYNKHLWSITFGGFMAIIPFFLGFIFPPFFIGAIALFITGYIIGPMVMKTAQEREKMRKYFAKKYDEESTGKR